MSRFLNRAALLSVLLSFATGIAAARVKRHTYNAPPDKVFEAAIQVARAMGGTITAEGRGRGVLDFHTGNGSGKYSSMETPRGLTCHITMGPAPGGKTVMLVDAHAIGSYQTSDLCRDCASDTIAKAFMKRVGRVLKGKPARGPVIVGGRIPLPGRPGR